jgi:hypothetical protein
MVAAQQKMTEEQAVNLVRNALLVAGQEMGAEGDHWPVIKSTVHGIMKDFENLKVERNVFAEYKKHYEDMIRQMQTLCSNSPEDIKPVIRESIFELIEIYNATFSPINDEVGHVGEEARPLHLKRAELIVKSLEEENE